MRTRLLVTLAAALLAGACGETPTDGVDPIQSTMDGDPVPLERFNQYYPAFNSGFEKPVRIVVSTQPAWETAWRTIWQNASPVPPAPAVNFDTHVVLLAAMGMRSSGGYRIQVHAAAGRGDHLGVRVVETSPGASCFTTAAITQPVDIVKLPRTEFPIRWETEQVVHECR